MILPFEKLNVDVSCLGNHELDHGIEKCEELMLKCIGIFAGETRCTNRSLSPSRPQFR